MIDSEGFRANVGIIITNQRGQLLWAKRYAQNAWQFLKAVWMMEKVQNKPCTASYEEVGLKPDDVKSKQSDEWYRYRLPEKFIRKEALIKSGKNGKWFLLQLVGDENRIRFDCGSHPEFDHWRWVNYCIPCAV